MIPIRKILQLNESHINDYTEIAYNAYPSFKDFNPEAMVEYKKRVLEIMREDPIVTFYGMFQEDKLIAVMRLFDFQMNCFGKILPVSGLGFLGVHLMHKKEKVAKAMVEFYEDIYRKNGIPIASLLPFRPDFYKKMGYGFGTKMNQYRLPPGRIPAFHGETDLRYVKPAQYSEIYRCHARVSSKLHGMMLKFSDEYLNMEDPFLHVVASYNERGEMEGYLTYQFQNGKAGNYTINHLYVKELIYENKAALQKLLGFLRKQEDQVQLVIFSTEDEYFHYLFDNPLNDSLNYIPFGYIESNTQALGIMYKILDVPKAFQQCAHRNFNHSNLGIRLLIEDDFSNQSIDLILQFQDGKVRLDQSHYDLTLQMSLADFSSLFMGSVTVKGLHSLGLLSLDKEEYLDDLDFAFYYPQKPVCYTDF